MSVAATAATMQPVTFWPNERMNPYIRLITDGFAARGFRLRFWTAGQPALPREIFHLHWIEALAASRFAARNVTIARWKFWRLLRHMRAVQRRGGAVVLTAHNLRPHETGTGARATMLRRWLGRIYAELDAVVCMSQASARLVAEQYPYLAERLHVIRHPDYRNEYDEVPADAGLYRGLGVPAGAVRLVVPGLMRPYKKIEQIIEAFRAVARDDEVLVIAGPCFVPGYGETLTRLAGDDPRIRLRIAELPSADYAELVREADIALVLQDNLLNSGSIIAALSLATPVIAIDVPTTRETADLAGPHCIALIDALAPATLRAAIDEVRGWPAATPDLARFEAGHIADQHVALYRTLLNRRASAQPKASR